MKQLHLSFLLLLISFNLSAESDTQSYWQADGGELKISFFYELLKDYDIQINDGLKNRNSDWSKNQLVFPVKGIGGLNLSVPNGGLKAVTHGQLNVTGQFSWHSNQQTIFISQLVIRPSSKPLKTGELTALELVDSKGHVLFFLDHIHAGLSADKTWVNFNNMDLRASKYLANHLNKPFLSGLVVGNANMKNRITVPVSYEKHSDEKLGACVADNWPDENNPADIQLIQMNAQYVRSIGTEHAVFTPSATLKNISNADIPWHEKFTGSFPPHNNDQHPYLIWSMYREIDGRFEQIGFSGIKHAFFSVNSGCSCQGGHVIFPGCEDTYGVTNNDTGNHLGPIDEISAFSGLWQSTGSFFDQIPAGGDGSYDTGSNGTDQNRMVVAEVDFVDTAMDHYISAWYIIRDDIDIFNSMGYREFDIDVNGSGWIADSQSDFANGPASDQYVTPNTLDLVAGTASKRILQAGEGHITVAVKVNANMDGTYQYNYMVENHDYDPQVHVIEIPLYDSASMTEFVFADQDENLGNDWAVTRNNDVLTLRAPLDNEIDWGVLYSFSFTTDSAPLEGDVALTGLENGGSRFKTRIITPAYEDLIFENRFENLN